MLVVGGWGKGRQMGLCIFCIPVFSRSGWCGEGWVEDAVYSREMALLDSCCWLSVLMKLCQVLGWLRYGYRALKICL